MFKISLLHLCNKTLSRLEGGEVVSVNNQRCILGNITSGLLCAMLHNKATKAPEVDVFLV